MSKRLTPAGLSFYSSTRSEVTTRVLTDSWFRIKIFQTGLACGFLIQLELFARSTQILPNRFNVNMLSFISLQPIEFLQFLKTSSSQWPVFWNLRNSIGWKDINEINYNFQFWWIRIDFGYVLVFIFVQSSTSYRCLIRSVESVKFITVKIFLKISFKLYRKFLPNQTVFWTKSFRHYHDPLMII